jgi:hypothetical protein
MFQRGQKVFPKMKSGGTHKGTIEEYLKNSNSKASSHLANQGYFYVIKIKNDIFGRRIILCGADPAVSSGDLFLEEDILSYEEEGQFSFDFYSNRKSKKLPEDKDEN